ncbi:MAG: class A beta-lactamase-related serine hydrolase [Rhodothermaceae bacterium]|nr:class A beta-lactamase-related serine hydrolase [Rhodothermaceae bacterium]
MRHNAKQERLTALNTGIDQLLEGYPEATVAISLIDPSSAFSFNVNENRIFHAASLMKVPVMIEVVKLISTNTLSFDEKIPVTNRFRSVVDQSFYSIGDDSDEITYKELGESLSIRELILRMITVSSNIATNILIDVIDIASLSQTLRGLNVKHSTVLRGVEDLKAFEAGLNNTITSSDMALIFHALLKGEVISRKYDDVMIDVLLGQKLNEMIPAGLPPGTAIAHKTGEITEIHHDAGIIYPSHGTPFVLVILIEGIAQKIKSAQLGKELSKLVYRLIRP